MRRLAFALACSAAAASVAHAQPKPAPETVEKVRARALLKAANDLAKSGRQRDAIPLYEDAYKLYPSSGISINLGLALHQLGDFVESAVVYQRVLDDPARTPEQAATAGAELDKLDQQLTRVAIVVEPTDASPVELAVDAGAWGPLPTARLIRVGPGAHRVQARGGGVTIVAEATIDAVPGVAQTVTLRLVAEPLPPPVEPPPVEPPPVEPPPIEPPTEPIAIVGPVAPRRPSRFGALVHLVVQPGLHGGAGATAAIGATYAPHDRVTLSVGAMAGGNYAGFASVTIGLLPGRFRPTLSVGPVLSYYGGSDAMTNPATTVFGARGAIGGELRLSARISAIVDLAAEYYPSAPAHLYATSFTPTVGVHARL